MYVRQASDQRVPHEVLPVTTCNGAVRYAIALWFLAPAARLAQPEPAQAAAHDGAQQHASTAEDGMEDEQEERKPAGGMAQPRGERASETTVMAMLT